MRKHLVPVWGCALACALAAPGRSSMGSEPVEATPTCGACRSYYGAAYTGYRPVVTVETITLNMTASALV